MEHTHSHDHHPHSEHAHGAPVERNLLLAFALTTLAMFAEAAGGWFSGSLALLSDAAHMLIDSFALLLAWAGAHFAKRPADTLRSFGYARLEVLVGYTNALAQLALTVWILVEAFDRLRDPGPIQSGLMLTIASIGLIVNVIVLRVLGGHAHDDLNVAGARLHVIGDLLGSLGAVIAAIVISQLGWLRADPIVSVLVALLILKSAWSLMRRAAHILLEGIPEGVECSDVAATVKREAQLEDVHHVHVWQLAGGLRMATLHAQTIEGGDSDVALAAVQRILRERFKIVHATIQIETARCLSDDCRDASFSQRHVDEHHH